VSPIDEDLDDVEVLAPETERQRRSRTLPLAIGTLALCGALGVVVGSRMQAPPGAPQLAAVTVPAKAAAPKPKPVSNLLTYRADRAGQFFVDAFD
jgi:hypothetical protein